MPGIISPSPLNISVPKGFAVFTPTGGIPFQLGNMQKFTYKPNIIVKPHFTQQLGIKTQDFSAILQTGGTITADLEERTANNLNLFFNGTIDSTNPNAVAVNMWADVLQISGKLQFYGTGAVGPRWQLNMNYVLISPQGDFEMIGDDFAGTTVTITHVIDQNLTYGQAILQPALNAIPPQNVFLPFITGPLDQGAIPAFAFVGELMTANIGAWMSLTGVTFQWFANAVLIPVRRMTLSFLPVIKSVRC
jgi:hypothetical protein